MKKRLNVILLVVVSIGLTANGPVSVAQSPQRPPESNFAPPEESNIFVDLDTRVFILMAALNMAGYDFESGGQGLTPLRQRLREDLANMDADLRARLTQYYQTHKLAGVQEPSQVTRYVTLSLAVTPPPVLTLETKADRLPSDVASVTDFAPLIQEFYAKSGVAKLIPSYRRQYENQTQAIRRRVGEMLFDTTNYLHMTPALTLYGEAGAKKAEEQKSGEASTRSTPSTRSKEEPAARRERNLLRQERTRRLFVMLSPLDAAGAAYIRNDVLNAADKETYRQRGDDYFVVLGPSSHPGELHAGPLRTALLRFILEPLGERFATQIQQHAEAVNKLASQIIGAEAAQRETAFSIINESLVRAVEARWNRTKTGNSVAAAEADDEITYDLGTHYERGAALAFHFYEKLAAWEPVGVDLATYYEEMLGSINFEKEAARPAGYRDGRAHVEARRAARAKSPPVVDKTVERLTQANQLIQQRRFQEAQPLLHEILKTNPTHARALYGLAQVTSQLAGQINPEKSQDQDAAWEQMILQLRHALKLYRQAIEHASVENEKWLISQAHVAIGRILDFGREREAAIAEYQRAVDLGDMPGGAYAQAKEGLQRPLVK
jgi:hypothetical protein